ncbi:FAD-binding oxidoreductase [Oceanobacter mangrovi]|uniref:FAD-binding oxidoreductase n=1 Tax=Oceanobacter mangrovi TaxID=2862510 RepID=UPI001C8E5636|nr:2Fe-2S iron-sulfur cluster binding domain-containing protein [Oceanobacter mangrovi]
MNASVHQVELVFCDGVTQTITASSGQSLLDAAVAANVAVMHQCRSGSCSSCIAQLTDGTTSKLAGSSSTLLTSEYDAGQRLLCVCQAESDCRLTLSYSSAAAAVTAGTAHAFINSIESIADDVVRLRLELAEGSWMKFQPGQYVQIEVPGCGQLRSYSPYSTAEQLPYMDFMIRIQPLGVMSEWLRQHAEVDQVLTLTGPYGAFFLRPEHKRKPHIFIAGGTGLAPVLSMIDSLRNQGGLRPPVLLSFGCSSAASLFGIEDIRLRQRWMPNLDARVCVSREAVPGCLQQNLLDAISPNDIKPDSVAYLCGPPAMVEAATQKLLQHGVAADHIYSEPFVASH